jgi:hypothetical protein
MIQPHSRSGLGLLAPFFAAACCVFASTASAQDADAEVELVFRNTTSADVALYVVQPEGTEDLIVEQLAAGSQVAVNALPGNVWVAKIGENVLAEYEADIEAQQIIDLADLATWQLPVLVVFQNNTEQSAEVVFVKEDGTEEVYADDLQPEQQFEQDGVTPGSLWRIKQDSKLVAEYIADNVPAQVIDLNTLLAQYAAPVTLTFKNTTTGPIDVAWVHPDGSPIAYLTDMPSATQIDQQSFPGHVWMVSQGGALVGVFVAGNGKKQDVDVGAIAQRLFEASQQLADAAKPAEPTETETTKPGTLPPPKKSTLPPPKKRGTTGSNP